MGAQALSGLAGARARGERQARRAASADTPVPSTMGDGPPANSGHLVAVPGRASQTAAYAAAGRASALDAMLMTDETTIAQIVGHNIRLAREHAGLSQEELTRRIGHQDRRHLSRWERGLRLPTEPNLRRLAAELDVAILWFYGEHDA